MNCQDSPVDRAYQWSVLKRTHTNVGTKTGKQFTQAGFIYCIKKCSIKICMDWNYCIRY